ncbi:MAG TPA: CHAT domain-containing protein [Pyrinomonadaceae bacterium]|jgi:CHAT domain-containing protein
MIKPPLLFRTLVLLACILAFTPAPTRPTDDDLVRNLTTVAARRDTLTQLLALRTQLEAAGNTVDLVRVNNQIIQLYLKLFDLDAAATETQHSLNLAEPLAGSNDAPLLVDTLVLAARVYIRRNENQKALDVLDRALGLSTELNYADGEAQTRAQFGAVYFELDRRDEAETMNNSALNIWHGSPNKAAEAQTLTNQGEIYMVADRANEATSALQQAETIWRSLNDNAGVATALIDLAFLAIRQGQWQTALSYLNQVESLNIEKDAEPYIAGQVAIGFGLVYEAYNQLENAQRYLEESLRYYRDGAHDKRAAVDAQTKLARVQAARGDYDGARQQIQAVLADAIATNNNLTIGLSHEDLGRVWLEAHSYENARSEFLAAIDYFTRSNSARPLARAQMYLGQTEDLLGNLTQAAAAYQKALPYFETNPDYTNEAALRFGLGKLALQQGRLKQANESLERSIKLTEQLRENAWSKELRSSFLALVHERYQSYVELLMTRSAQEHNRELEIRAFEASESGRARALIDSLHDLRELRQPSDPSLLLKEAQLQKEEQKLIDAHAKLVSQSVSEAEIGELDKKLREVRANNEALQARINDRDKSSYLLCPTPLTYEEIQNEVTDAETSLLSFSLGARKSYAWIITKDGPYSFELPDKQTINNAADRLIRLLEAPPAGATHEAELQSAISDVSRLVVEPLSEKLRTSRLVIVADGVLQYVPFQILKTSAGASEPLISHFDIVEAPSASALALLRRQRLNGQRNSTKLLVGFGDAVFSPEYLPAGANAETGTQVAETRSEDSSKLSKLPRLFNAKRELLAISQLTGNDSAFFVEYDATRENLLSVDLSQYRILHVVTHGMLDAQKPELSGLVLSLINANKQPIPGFVSLADIYKLRAPELVVLSACYTALGQEQNGEGLIGVTRGFMHAGASGVVATLWQVNDRASAELMKYFYENMLQRNMKPAEALRDAQNKVRSRPEWSSPYYWAGFTYQGDYDLRISPAAPGTIKTYRRLIAGGPLLILLIGVCYWYVRRRRRAKARV